MTALVLVVGGCRHFAALPDPNPPGASFVREFIRVLQDSGSGAVLSLATPKTRTLRGFAPNMESLRGVLMSSHATMALTHWEEVPSKDGRSKLIHLVYKVRGAGAPSELGFWLEKESDHYLLNTIAIGPPNVAEAE